MHRRDATSLLWVAVADCATHTPRLVSLYLVSPYAVLPWLEAWLGFPRAAGTHAIVFPCPIPKVGESCTAW